MQAIRAPVTGTEFTVPEFIQHFQEQDSLPVPADQSLIIRKVSQYISKASNEALPEDSGERMIYIMNKLLLPLGKRMTMSYSQGGEGSFEVDVDFTFRLSKQVVFTAYAGRIVARVDEFFRMMVATSRLTVKFVARQELILTGFLEGEREKLTSWQALANLFATRTRAGFITSFNMKGGATMSSLQISQGKGPHQKGISLQGVDEMEISLENTYVFHSLKSFADSLTYGNIEVPAGQKLTIHDRILATLFTQYQGNFESPISFLEFLCGYLEMFSDRKIVITPGKGIDFTLEENWYSLTLTDEEGFTVRLHEEGSSPQTIFTDMKNLGNSLIERHLSSFTLQPHQTLLIYDVDESKVTPWITSRDFQTVFEGFLGYLQLKNPMGYVWKSDDFSGRFRIQFDPIAGNESKKMLRVSVEPSLTLCLNRANGEWLALNILENSSKELLVALQEGDEDVYIFLLFKALFYYCCMDFRSYRTEEDESFLPFKSQTRDAVLKLVNKDVDFSEAIKILQQNDTVYDELTEILQMSPEQFKQMHLDELTAVVKQVVAKIRGLTFTELYGSPFINQCLKNVTLFLEKRSE